MGHYIQCDNCGHEKCQCLDTSGVQMVTTDYINDKQIGGKHYKAEYQHWDLVADLKLPYFEAVATKYITRWKKKNGAEDLDKAVHYLEKLIEISEKTYITGKKYPDNKYIEMFFKHNLVNVIEKKIITDTIKWQNSDDIREVIKLIEALKDTFRAGQATF